jgi:outer membrane protein
MTRQPIIGGVVVLTLALGQPATAAQEATGPGTTLTLEQALVVARRHSRLAEARAAAAGADARLDASRAGWFPSADIALGAWWATASPAPKPGEKLPDRLTSAASPPGPRTFGVVAAGVSQPIWDFGRTSNRIRAARAELRAAVSDVEVVWLEVDLAVRLAYHEALAAAQLLRIADETVANLERRLGIARTLVEVGKRPPSDVSKSRIDLSNGRLARLVAESTLTDLKLALAAAMGVDDLGQATLARPPSANRKDPELAEVLAASLAGRPELRSLEAQLSAQGARLDAQRSSYWPLLTAGADVAFRGVDPPAGLVVPNWQLGLKLSVPLLAGGSDRARVREQEAILSGLAAARSTLVLQLRVEAQRLVSAVSAARGRAIAAEAIVVQAREHLDLAETRYSAGVGNIIELADAQTIGAAAEAQQVRSEYDLAAARARLQRTMGLEPR